MADFNNFIKDFEEKKAKKLIKNDRFPIQGKILASESMGVSRMGNPKYRLVVQDKDGKVHIGETMTDANFAYSYSNQPYGSFQAKKGKEGKLIFEHGNFFHEDD